MPDRVERVAGDVEAQEFFFRRELFREGPRRPRVERPLHRLGRRGQVIEHGKLPAQAVAVRAGGAGHDRVELGEHLGAVAAGEIQRAATHEAFEDFLVHHPAVEPRAKVFQRREAPAPVAVFDHAGHRRRADVLDRRQAEADRRQ